ncbi:DUF3299 domain-containing protein [Aliiglaciecola sp.]|nr:DUF3299 domain-containing protein [Aliiglaciecola sp.]
MPLCYNIFHNLTLDFLYHMFRTIFQTSLILASTLFLSLSFHIMANTAEFEEIEWVELMPKDDLAALMDPPDFLLGIVDGSSEDNIDRLAKEGKTSEKAKRFEAALKSESVISSFAGRNIRIPGFIVPLSTNEKREVVEFFIVPYFGACLHMPPPPPNQIIFSSQADGILVEDISAPFWFEGKVKIETRANDMGTAAYALTLDNVKPY